jgi:hypothetical protein
MQIQFNLKSVLLQYLSRNMEYYREGKEISLPLHTQQTGGWSWSDTGQLPEAGEQRVARHTYEYKRMYGTIEIDGPHVEGAASSASAEQRPYDFETRNLVKQMRHGLNFDLFGDGSGKVASIASAADGTSCVVDDVRGLVDGMRVDVLITATGATGAGGVSKARITINRSTKTITLSNAKTWVDGTGVDLNTNAANYTMYRSGARNQAIFGLDAVIATGNPAVGNYGNLDRTASGNEYWQGNVFANGGVPRAASFPLISEAVSEVEKRSDGETNLIICGYEVWTQLLNDLVTARRYPNDVTKLNGWASAIMHDEIPIVRDKHCDPTKMYLLDTSMWELFENDEGQWMDKDGAILSRVPGRHAYEAAWFRFLQIVCHAPNANAVLEDLDTATPVV